MAGKPCTSWRTFFPPTTSLDFLGRSLGFRSETFSKSSGTEEERLRRCVLGSASGAQEPNSTIMQNIMKTFHSAMKIRKYLRLSRNSRMLSPVLGSLDSSPKPCVSFFFRWFAVTSSSSVILPGPPLAPQIIAMTTAIDGVEAVVRGCQMWG